MSFTKPDNPITNSDDDKLGFEPLAKRVANSIISSNIDITDSFTISIEGKWGSGKTSLVNLIKSDIKDKVVVMEFNPWIVTDFEQLVEYFFSELLKEIIHESFDAKLEEDIWKDIKKFVAFFTPNRISIGISGTKITYNPKDTLFNKDEQTLLELKSKINGYLEKLNKKIVIIVDDIDRLTDKETETFFRLIKGIADFNNIIYLLLYDKAIVAKSLEQFKQENGERYLDKIVQYSLSIPKIYSSELNSMLREKINKILKENPNHYFNEEKWDRLLPSLDKYITNIRDINKVINVISFEYPQIAEDVDFTDFFIISLIKVQKYELYEAIRDKKYVFDKIEFLSVSISKDTMNQAKKDFSEDFLIPFKMYKPLIDKLLPSIKNREDDINFPLMHKDKPMDSVYYFDNYFTFTISDNRISEQRYKNLSQKLFIDNFKEFKDDIITINRISQVVYFLEMFIHRDTIKVVKNMNYSKNVIINLLTISEKHIVDSSFLYFEYISRAISLFQKIEEKEIILKAIYIDVNFISLETKVAFYAKIKKDNQFDKDISNTIEKKLINAIKLITLDDIINIKNNLNSILYFFSFISSCKSLNFSVEHLIHEIDEMIFKSRNDFFNILTLFKSDVSIGSKSFPVISSEKIAKYTNLNMKNIEEYINNLNKETLTLKELEILKAWKLRNES